MDNSIFHEKQEIVYDRRRFFYEPELFLWLDKSGNFAPPDMQKKLNNYVFDVDAIPERVMGEKKDNAEAYKIAKRSFEKRISGEKPDYTKWYKVTYKGKKYVFNPSAFGRGSFAEETREGKPGKYVPSALQSVLNDMVFGRRDLPSLLERFKNSNSIEQKQQIKIALGWLQLKVKQLQGNGGRNVPNLIVPGNPNFKIGGMYFFVYDAKTKEKLNYWDKFPLIIVLNKYDDGFLGMNLHYLNPNVRLMFLSKLLSAYGNTKGDELALKNISYNEMKTSGMKYYLPCLKRYLTTHLRSMVLPAEAHEWIHAAYLPVDNFQKQKNSVVWRDSDNTIR
jgi:hypothetical protein